MSDETATMRFNLVRHLVLLADTRQALASNKSELTLLRDGFDLKHQDLIAAVADLGRRVVALTTLARQGAIDLHNETHEGEVAPGIAVVQETELVYDAATALAWAIEHRLALRLDTAAFEAMAQASPDQFSFVTVQKCPGTRIMADNVKLYTLATAEFDRIRVVQEEDGGSQGHWQERKNEQ